MPSSPSRRSARMPQSDTLADILERVLETGIVVAGDIRVNLNDVELLTIQIRLIVCSVDKAQEMGMDWWKNADYLSAEHGRRLSGEGEESGDESGDTSLEEVSARLAALERRLEALDDAEEGENDNAP